MAWQDEHGANAPTRISVNVSARQLNEPGFVAVVADVLEKTGIPAGSLIVEVTETGVFGRTLSRGSAVDGKLAVFG